ncbi:MAG: hypothetical protein L0Z53_28345 [Acidobacteriales bacterium]|nr:hypothetical protein [Terriglobales bacterium]
MKRATSTYPPWLNIGMIGGILSLAGGILGFYDYFVPPASLQGLIDLEENLSDLYIAGLALVGGILGIRSSLKSS